MQNHIAILGFNGVGTIASAPSLKDLFQNFAQYLEEIPEKRRVNLYYTVAEVELGRARKLYRQRAIPFDIDGCEAPLSDSQIDAYIDIFCEFLGLERGSFPVVMSGHGLHLVVPTTQVIVKESEFKDKRQYYKWICQTLDSRFELAGLSGRCDDCVYKPTQVLRLPGTWNVKTNKEPVMATFVEDGYEEHDFDLAIKSGTPYVDQSQSVDPKIYQGMTDTDSVLNGCEFLKWAKDNPQEVSEPQWYAELGILAQLENGKALCHEYSLGGRGYSEKETDLKYEQAKHASRGRLCSSINSLWGECEKCPNWQKVRTPLQIRGADFIATEFTGFRLVKLKDGKPTGARPAQHLDLVKYFHREHPYFTDVHTGDIYVYKEMYWQRLNDRYLENFAEEYFKPDPNTSEVKQFVDKLKRRNLEEPDKFYENPNLMNFHNGTLDISTGELLDHSKDHFKNYCLPFDYDPTARCPRFNSFLDEVTEGDKATQQVILEYFGYCLSGLPSKLGQKALIFVGEGANGKSVLLEVLKSMASPHSYSCLQMGKAFENHFNLDLLKNKLFNISEETPPTVRALGEQFKNLVSGGEVTAAQKGKDPYKMANNAKLIMCANKLPTYLEASDGLFRRMLIVEFRRQFLGDDADPQLLEKLREEIPGIFNRVYRAFAVFYGDLKFTVASRVTKTVEAYRRDVDPIAQFIDEKLEKKDGEFTTSKEVYGEYSLWCQENGYRPVNSVQLSRALARKLDGVKFDKKYLNLNTNGAGTGKEYRGMFNYTVVQD